MNCNEKLIHMNKQIIKSNKIEKNNENDRNIYYICKNKAGGSWKYLLDIFSVYKFKKFIEIESINTEIVYGSILIIQSFLFTNFDLSKLLQKIEDHNLEVIIPIHDFYWLCLPLPKQYDNNVHKIYLNKIYLNKNVKKLFNISKNVICPCNFILEEYKKYIEDANYIVIPHIDLHNDYKINSYNEIKNDIINIGILHAFSEYKGQELYELLMEKITHFKNYKINYLITGVSIPEYTEHNFYKYTEDYNIHGFLFLNKWGESFCYSLTKAINTGLPIFYNNIGSFKERLPEKCNYFKNILNNQNEFYDTDKLFENYTNFLEHIINHPFKKNNILKLNLNVNTSFNDIYNYYENIVIIPSKIIVSNKQLSYTSTRSVYSTEERYLDTIKTINSLTEKIPNVFIILIDNSVLPSDKLSNLKKITNHIINVTNNKEYNYSTDESIYKGYGEINNTLKATQFIKENNFSFKNLFKISGRYYLNDTFNIINYNNEFNLFKKNIKVTDRDYYYTCLYKISYCNFKEYHQALLETLEIYKKESFKQFNNFNDLEVILPELLNFNFNEIDNLGLVENISITKNKNNI